MARRIRRSLDSTTSSRVRRRRVERSAEGNTRRRRGRTDRRGASSRQSIIAFDNESVLVPTISGPQENAYRDHEYLHVSDLIYKCARKIALSEQLSMPMPSELLFPSQGITFALGHAVEDFVIQRIKEKSPSVLWGTFVCLCGETTATGIYSRIRRKGSKCQKCGTVPEKYQELTLYDNEYMLQGNVDIVYYLHDIAYYLSELKSMAAHRWNDLQAPVPDHLIQILLYWWMAKRNGMDLYDKVSLLYVNKEWGMKSPYKEFVVQPSLMMDRIEPYLAEAAILRDARNGGTLPERVRCGTREDYNAKKCHVCQECFTL